MHLLDLAPELIDQIIDWSMPAGFESFALSCKTIHMRSQSRIALHNDLKKKWSHANTEFARGGDILRLIHEIAKEPLVSRYIDALSLYDKRRLLNLHRGTGRGGVEELPEDRDPDHNFRDDKTAMRRIKEVVVASPYFRLANVDPEGWWREMEEEAHRYPDENCNDSPFASISLLLMVPNVTALQLGPSWGRSRQFLTQAEKEKVETFLNPMLGALGGYSYAPQLDGKSLGKLKTILPFMPAGYEQKSGFGCVEVFALMPTVGEMFLISCLAVDDGYTGIEFHWETPDLTSNVRRLELAYCCMDADGISNILTRMPKLEAFKYDHDVKWHGCLYEWNPGEFIDVVAKHCGPNLTELAVTCHEVGEIENGFHDFHRFPKLRRLELDVNILKAPPVPSGQKRGMCGFLPEGMKAWEESELPCLATILPPSLEELHVITDYPDTGDTSHSHAIALKALLTGFGGERIKRLPKLHTAIVRQFNRETAKALVESESLLFENWRAEELYPPSPGGTRHSQRNSRDRTPLWIREFEDKSGRIDYN